MASGSSRFRDSLGSGQTDYMWMKSPEGNFKEGLERNMKMESEHSIKGEDAKWRLGLS